MRSSVAVLHRSDGSASDAVVTRRNPSHSIGEPAVLRPATADDAPAIHALITSHLDEGHLLPRRVEEIAIHASRFIVAMNDDEVVGCIDLAPLSRTVAEIRSLVVSEDVRSAGIGRRLIDTVIAHAAAAGFERVCAFTHAPSYFVRRGFSLVPHEWLPEKIRTDCGSCALFRKCGQYAVMRSLSRISFHG